MSDQIICIQRPIIDALIKETKRVYSNSEDCEHLELEPDTCMTYMRCERCGIPAHLAKFIETAKTNIAILEVYKANLKGKDA